MRTRARAVIVDLLSIVILVFTAICVIGFSRFRELSQRLTPRVQDAAQWIRKLFD